MVKGIGREDQGLYILKSNTVEPTSSSCSLNKCVNTVQLSDSSILWHRRLGHAPLKVIIRHESLSHLKCEGQMFHVCPLAKHTKLPFPISLSKSKFIFELVHCDI